MATKMRGEASLPAKQKYDEQDVKKPRRMTDHTIYAGRQTISRKDWGTGKDHYENQMPEDKQDTGRGRYKNDVPEGSFLRGGGESQHIYGSKNQNPKARPKPAKSLGGGGDVHSSPFSAASHDRRDENDWSESYRPTRFKGG